MKDTRDYKYFDRSKFKNNLNEKLSEDTPFLYKQSKI